MRNRLLRSMMRSDAQTMQATTATATIIRLTVNRTRGRRIEVTIS